MRRKTNCIFWLLIIFYLATRLFKLTALPVFADESIYIRWSQLIIDDWQQYLFFSFNDGKTPLQMWLMIPLQLIFDNALLAGRILSVIAGLIQILVMRQLIKILNGKKLAQYLAIFLSIILPFWFFHHRMALIDALLVLICSISLLFMIKAIKVNQPKFALTNSLLAGIFLGLALWTKIPALLFIPSLLLTIFLAEKPWTKLNYPSLAIILGLSIFASFKLHPAFGQLFNRGNDFLYSLNEFLARPGQIIWHNLVNFIDLSIKYLTWPVLILALASFKNHKYRKQQIILILMGLSFAAPILLLGKTIYPRYLMYISLPITLAASLNIEYLWKKYQQFSKQILLIILLTISLFSSLRFIIFSYFSLENIPFTKIDQTQYLNEWSAGFGIAESVVYIKQLSKTQKVLVATEGFFGTMPDGVLMYLHRKNVDNLCVEGIGQPVGAVPESFLAKVKNYDQVILLVNSHRLNLDKNKIILLKEYCRPGGICHQIWDITDLSNQLAEDF